ncbi:MAG: hypothetical protein ACLQG5_09295 [Methanobacterium sp.]
MQHHYSNIEYYLGSKALIVMVVKNLYVYTMTVDVGSQYIVIVNVGAEDGQVLHIDDTRYPD